MSENKKSVFSLPRTYWISIIFEFFERGSYYAVMGILALHLSDYLKLPKEEFGIVTGTVIPFLIYGLPIITGAIADRLGYRKMLMFAFAMMGIGYGITSQMNGLGGIFVGLIVLGIGAGSFKPVISGTIAKVTDEHTSNMGFGIFYWTINLGAFLFPLILVTVLKKHDPVVNATDYSNLFIAAAIATGALLIPTILIYKEPKREKVKEKEKILDTLKGIGQKVAMVFMDWRFMLFMCIYSMFWILYFQMQVGVLWYVRDFVDASALNTFVNNAFGEGWFNNLFGFDWYFDIEHVTVINAGTIIALQLFVSNIVKNTKAIPTMVTGILIGTAGMLVLAISSHIWIFMLGLIIFSIGEMTTHPKFISYLGTIAPPDKKATYMGFGFLYGVIGSSIGFPLGSFLYPRFVDYPLRDFVNSKITELGSGVSRLAENASVKEALELGRQIGLTDAQMQAQTDPSFLWIMFSIIGVVCMVLMLLYAKYIGERRQQDLS